MERQKIFGEYKLSFMQFRKKSIIFAEETIENKKGYIVHESIYYYYLL